MKRVLFVLSFGIFLYASPSVVFAARLSLYPSSATVNVGQTVSMSVIIASSDQAANAVSGNLSFPANKLQVVSVSKANSILSLWVEEPSFSNSAGTVTFQGVVPNPGFQSGRGTVLTVVFKAIAAGPANVSFSQASVLANDGSGSDILSDFQGASINVSGQAQEQTIVESKVPSSDPSVINITSKTHPAVNKWYSLKNAELSWNLPSGVSSSRYSFDKDSSVKPTTVNTPAIQSKTFENLEEGLWYFRLQTKKDTTWSSTYTFKVYVDYSPPEVNTFELVTGNTEQDSPYILLKSSDELSGVSSYRVKFGDRAYETYNASGSGDQTTITAKYPGKQVVIVEAYDNAGNKSIVAKELDVKTFNAPKIIDMPSVLDKGQELVVRGTAEPNIEVRVYLKNYQDKEVFASTRAGSAGEFSLTWKEPLEDGKYTVTAEAVNSFGVMSYRSDKRDLSVHPSILFRIGSFVVTVGSFVTFMIVVLMGIGYGVLILWKHFHRFRRKLGNEMDMIDRSVHTAFDMLKDEIRGEVKNLQKAKTKRQLTKEEERILEKFSADVSDAERFIEKQIRDIKKQV